MLRILLGGRHGPSGDPHFNPKFTKALRIVGSTIVGFVIGSSVHRSKYYNDIDQPTHEWDPDVWDYENTDLWTREMDYNQSAYGERKFEKARSIIENDKNK